MAPCFFRNRRSLTPTRHLAYFVVAVFVEEANGTRFEFAYCPDDDEGDADAAPDRSAGRDIRQTVAEMGCNGVVMRWVITGCLPGEFVAWALGSYRVAPTETGCRVEAALTVRVKPHLRVLEPVLWFAFRKGLRGDLARLAGILAERSHRRDAAVDQP